MKEDLKNEINKEDNSAAFIRYHDCRNNGGNA